MSDFDREERAFRAALTREADGFEPRELAVPDSSDREDQAEPTPADTIETDEKPARRRATLILAAAAAVVTVVGLGGALASLRSGSDEGSTVADGAASAEARDGSAPKALSESAEPPQGTYADKEHPGLPAPDAGKRWAVRFDVAAQVPQEWADAASPALPECIEKPGDQWDTVPRTPYVANVTNRPVPRIACDNTEDRDFPADFGKVPFSLWQPYLVVEKATKATDKKAGSWEHEGWLLTRVIEGDYIVSILTGPGDDKVNQEIQGSLTTVAKDPYGCDTASPLAGGDPVRPKTEPKSSPLTGGAPESIAICQYEPSSASLTGSRQTKGADAAGLVDAISAAPGRSGPNTPKNCLAGQPIASYVILRVFRDGEPGDVYVSYENCDDHGFYDGTTVHELTPAACRPVFAAEPVTIYSAQGDVARVCLR
ncbi:hypothetical protein FB381_3941 [Nocardioides albertanoniae]|uniref:Uncharacterized protein n=1 Tax=Nocardioides albertanoniae TaxID=1175486 RepID=A0A543ABT2_9ACTN|nr:hypothetical protein [Nocardioides albertanoniae]TQL70017.1 hypothetical protein FB381_3941 [Nocardioides albertanoniae]